MPTEVIPSKIVGVTYEDPRSGIDRQRIIRKFIKPGAKLEPWLEPDNPKDADAVALWYHWKLFGLFFEATYHLGYMTKTINKRIAEELRKGSKVKVTVKEVTSKEDIVGVNIEVSY